MIGTIHAQEADMRRYPLFAYLVLAYAITWLGVLPLVLNASVPPALHLAGALGPVSAAILVTASTRGRPGVYALIRATTRWRAAPVWLAITLISPFALFVLAIALTRPDLGRLSLWANDPLGLLNVLLISLAYGFGEEPGWRGFALPKLQARHSAFTATLVVAFVWAGWHLPFFAYRYSFQSMGAVAGFVATLFAGALWLTFLYNSTGGSVLAVALWHTIWNFLNLSMGPVAQQTVMVANVLMLALGFGVIWLGGPGHLFWSPEHRDKGDAGPGT